MKVLVTGGFGYLGGRIAKSLSAQGYKIRLGSRKIRSTPSWLQNAEVVQTIWGDSRKLFEICEGVDAIIHTAGINAQDCSLDPVRAIEFNGAETARLVKASCDAAVPRFIYLSTAHVYSSPLEGKISEDSCLLNNHPYATSHVAGENAVLYQDNPKQNLRTIVLRLSNLIGSPTHKDANCWQLAVNDFCRQVAETARIEVNSPADVERDFISISVLCSLIELLVNSDRLDDNLINVVSSKTISLKNIVETIEERTQKVFGFKPKVLFKNKNLINNNSLLISNDKLIKNIKFKNSLEDEIDQLLLNCKHWFG